MRRAEKGEQLEKIEPAELGISQPLANERSVQKNVWGFGRPGDRFAAARFAHLIVRRNEPDTGMSGVKCGKLKRFHKEPQTLMGTKDERQFTSRQI